VLKQGPKWQENDGPVLDLAGGSPATSTDAAAQISASDEFSAVPIGSKKAKRMQGDDGTVSKAMLSMAKSMVTSVDSFGNDAAAQIEHNGITLLMTKTMTCKHSSS
jgi:hemin uptake protein HemP